MSPSGMMETLLHLDYRGKIFVQQLLATCFSVILQRREKFL